MFAPPNYPPSNHPNLSLHPLCMLLLAVLVALVALAVLAVLWVHLRHRGVCLSLSLSLLGGIQGVVGGGRAGTTIPIHLPILHLPIPHAPPASVSFMEALHGWV